MMELKKFLNLKEVVVQGCQQLENIDMVFQIESEKKEVRCPRCQEMSEQLHQNHWPMVKDLPMCGQEVYLRVNHRQMKCKRCQKPFSEELDFIAPRRSYTKRLAIYILKQLKEGDILNVSKINGVTEEEIQRMLEELGEELSKIDVSGLKRLGLDEIAWVKGQKNYCAVLVDLDKGKPIGILKKRTQEELRKTLMGWGIEVLSDIEEVSIDLWEGYRSLIKELMPSAAIVADRFHVMKLVNEEMDKQRREEKK